MKDERKIIIRNERLQKIRNNLREILIRAVWDEIEILGNYANLYPPPLDLPPEQEVELYYLEGTRHKLFSLMSRCICQCALCLNQENNMIYIEIHDEWYCVECHENNRIWYPAHGSAENRWQNDYINMYYEMKEKFEKEYLNRKKENIDE
jgi:hypothetical protein